MVLMSAWMPAPAPESEPAMVRATGGLPAAVTDSIMPVEGARGLGVEAPGDPAGPVGRRARRPPRPAWPRPSGRGRRARVTAEATMTASQPSSMARQASEAVPMPASRTTGTPACSTMRAMLWGLRMPETAADRGAEGHHRGAPDLFETAGGDRVVAAVGEDDEAVVDQLLGRGHQLHGVGQQRPVVADDLELDPVGLEGLPGQLGGQDGLGRR